MRNPTRGTHASAVLQRHPDFRLDAPEGPPKASRIPPEQVKAELQKAGYVLVQEHGFLPRQFTFRGDRLEAIWPIEARAKLA